MTEPSPSPIPSPTPPSDQSWLDWFAPLDALWKDHPSITFIITAVALPLAIWLGKQAWKRWKQERHVQRVAARKQQLPPVRLPFTVELGNQRLTLVPAQLQQESTTEHMSIDRLLSAKSTPVPFLDRAKALNRLETWAQSDERFAIHVLGGDGGSGKTRLGVELCRRLTSPNTHRRGAEVWKAGFLQNIERSDNTSSNDDVSSLLLVVDYAEARPETVTEAINVALRAADDPDRRRVRIVFLVRRPSPLPVTRRSSNEWVDALRPQNSYIEDDQNAKNDGINSLLDGTPTIVLNEKTLSDRERKELFESAYKSFTEPPGSSPSSDMLDQLNDPMYSQPLLVTVDAFLNARPQSRTQQSCSPSELFEEVLCHEEHYWKKHWPSSLTTNTSQDQQAEGTTTPTDTQTKKIKSLNLKLARQAVATAMLTDIQDEEDAISLLQLLPAIPGNDSKDLAQWLRDCYPPHMNSNGHSASWCEHLQPDRIGEHLVISEVDSLVPLLRELLSPSRVGTSSLRTWAVLERISVDPKTKKHVGSILNDVLVEVTQEVQDQAVITQTPDLAAGFAKLFSAVRTHIKPDTAHEAKQTLSEGGHLTALLEYDLAHRAADISKPPDDASETDRASYALRQLSLSRCLATIGRHHEALKAAQQAADLFRVLDAQQPTTHTPDLAASLDNLALRLAKNGQHHEALKTAQDATNLYQTLPVDHLSSYSSNLAVSLNNLALRLSEDKQQDEALNAAQKATDLYCSLADKDWKAHAPNYATSLNNLATYLAEDGQRDEAIRTTRKAVGIRRELFTRNKVAYAPKLATSLINLAIYLSQVGQREEALKIAHEATNLYLDLAAQTPATYRPDLAKSLHILSLRLDENGQRNEALKTAQEAVNLYRDLFRSDPHTFGRDYIRCLNTYADILNHFDEPE